MQEIGLGGLEYIWTCCSCLAAIGLGFESQSVNNLSEVCKFSGNICGFSPGAPARSDNQKHSG